VRLVIVRATRASTRDRTLVVVAVAARAPRRARAPSSPPSTSRARARETPRIALEQTRAHDDMSSRCSRADAVARRASTASCGARARRAGTD